MLISSVCTLSLLLQSINLIVTAAMSSDPPGALYVILFILISEIVPAAFLLHLYGAKSGFIKNKRTKTKQTETRGDIKFKTKVNSATAFSKT